MLPWLDLQWPNLCSARLSCLPREALEVSVGLCAILNGPSDPGCNRGEHYWWDKNSRTMDFQGKLTEGWVAGISARSFSKCFSALSFSPLALHPCILQTSSRLCLNHCLGDCPLLPLLRLAAPGWSPLASKLFAAPCQLLPPTPWICNFI